MEDEELYNQYNQEFEQSSKQIDGNNIVQSGSNELIPNKVLILNHSWKEKITTRMTK
jgi:hypothetical protein